MSRNSSERRPVEAGPALGESEGLVGVDNGSVARHESTAHATSPDPFDLDALRVTPLQDLGLEKVLIAVPVRRPTRREFIRVHPDPAYSIDSWVLEHHNGIEPVTYWVAPALVPKLRDELRAVRLFTAITKRGTVFLWPAKLPLEDVTNSGREWYRTALVVAEEAKRCWVKLVGNKEAGAYECVRARGDLGEPQWPDKPYKELVRLAFRDHLIDSLDHPVIRELNGEL